MPVTNQGLTICTKVIPVTGSEEHDVRVYVASNGHRAMVDAQQEVS